MNIERRIAEIAALGDPVERALAAGELQAALQGDITALSEIRRDALEEALGQPGMTQAKLAPQVKMTTPRLSAFLGTAPAHRGLYTTKSRGRITAPILVTAKRESERQRPAVLVSTQNAVGRLQAALAELKIDSEIVPVDATTHPDLNAEHAIVMVGPRINPLVRMSVTADQFISWAVDAEGQWHLRDKKTGEDFVSDHNIIRPTRNAPRVCYGHIGRINRPDGQGSYLFIAGAHAPGTAGAVDYLIGHAEELWDKTGRTLWSAVVRVDTDHAGAVLGTELATPIYVNGRR